MDIQYIKQRFREQLQYITVLKDSANKQAEEGKTLLEKFKTEENEELKLEYLRDFKRLQFFNNLKLIEIEKILPVLVELVSISRVLGLDLELNDMEEHMYDEGKKRFQPAYIIQGNELVFLNKDMEDLINKELDTPSETDAEVVRKILRENKRWQKQQN